MPVKGMHDKRTQHHMFISSQIASTALTVTYVRSSRALTQKHTEATAAVEATQRVSKEAKLGALQSVKRNETCARAPVPPPTSRQCASCPKRGGKRQHSYRRGHGMRGRSLRRHDGLGSARRQLRTDRLTCELALGTTYSDSWLLSVVVLILSH